MLMQFLYAAGLVLLAEAKISYDKPELLSEISKYVI